MIHAPVRASTGRGATSATSTDEVWAATQRWYSSSSYVVARLTGAYVLDHHTASQCDPLYDIRAQDWAADWCDDIAPDLPLPELVWPSDVVGTVTAEAASETGLAEGTPVSAGTVDAWAESVSAGVRRSGDLMLMYGSTMFFVQVLPEFRSHPMLWTTAGAAACAVASSRCRRRPSAPVTATPCRAVIGNALVAPDTDWARVDC
jgi:xylulokinase